VLEYLEPADADSSELIKRLTSAPFMPPLAEEPIDGVSAIRSWIDDGAKP
jgi:hypothetical protein